MKTRIYLHREKILAAGETRHFIVQLPPDVQKIVALKVTASKNPVVGENHYHIGNLRLQRDGFLMCDFQLRSEFLEVVTFFNDAQSELEVETPACVSGGKNEWLELEIPNGATVLFGKFENNTDMPNFTLSIYFKYETKQ